MPLVRAVTAAPDVAPPESLESLLAQLGGADIDMRRRAARALSLYPEAAAALAARLEVEPAPRVRDALFGALVNIGGAQAADLVAPLLRSADAELRGGAVDSLKRLEADAVCTLDALLGDREPDVRLLAIEVTRGWPSALAGPRLRRIIESDPHVNVCGAAVDVATEVGAKDLVDALIALPDRFAGDPFLIFAVDVALSRIQAADEPGA